MPTRDINKVDGTLLSRRTELIVCSRCLQTGRKTPIAQIISPRHGPRTLCPTCRATRSMRG